jgi:undecaprenyl-diphosphatase
LLAVLWYYRADLVSMAHAWGYSLIGGPSSADSKLVWYLALATIPAGLIGFIGRDFIESEFRSLGAIATTTLIFGLLLGLADRGGSKPGSGVAMSLLVAFLIGVAQAMALVPGVSRSGATITAGLFLGLDRAHAARFSFLLSIPIIAAAGALKGWDLHTSDAAVNGAMMAAGVLISGVSAYLCIAVFLRLLDRVGMKPFVYYRVILAFLLYALWLY